MSTCDALHHLITHISPPPYLTKALGLLSEVLFLLGVDPRESLPSPKGFVPDSDTTVPCRTKQVPFRSAV